MISKGGSKRLAFTLAEVLITLGVIGVVAAMTLPTLIGKYKEKQTVTAVKTAYSLFSQAFMQVVNDNGSFENLRSSENTPKENGKILLKELSKYMKQIKTCDTQGGCMPDRYKSLTGVESLIWDSHSHAATGVLTNGMSFFVINNTNTQLGVDINGRKGPNQLGIDLFWFAVDNEGRVHPGTAVSDLQDKYSQCDIEDFTNNLNGLYCTEWIIKYDNMDYLRRRVTIDSPEESE